MILSQPLNWKQAFLIPLVIFILSFIISLSSVFKQNPTILSTALVLDCIITAPFLYYLVIRKTSISKLSILRVFVIGVLVAGFILGSNSNFLLSFIKTWISPIIELLIILFIGKLFYEAKRNAKNSSLESLDFMNTSRKVLMDFIGNQKAANIISSEMGVLYYVFIASKDKSIDNKIKFSNYKENGILVVLITFLCLLTIETSLVHFLLALWNNMFAWILTGLSLYTCLQLLAHIRAIKARSIELKSNSLVIYNGLAGEAHISYSNIERIEKSKKIPANKKVEKIALLDVLEAHNMIIYLKEPISIFKVFGLKREADTVIFYVDKHDTFLKELNKKLVL